LDGCKSTGCAFAVKWKQIINPQGDAMRTVSLILLGFGNVGQAVARLILRKRLRWKSNFKFK
jgi:lactate dehydrogenase-like 2-hydroxyacid dehydrogenase